VAASSGSKACELVVVKGEKVPQDKARMIQQMLQKGMPPVEVAEIASMTETQIWKYADAASLVPQDKVTMMQRMLQKGMPPAEVADVASMTEMQVLKCTHALGPVLTAMAASKGSQDLSVLSWVGSHDHPKVGSHYGHVSRHFQRHHSPRKPRGSVQAH